MHQVIIMDYVTEIPFLELKKAIKRVTKTTKTTIIRISQRDRGCIVAFSYKKEDVGVRDTNPNNLENMW